MSEADTEVEVAAWASRIVSDVLGAHPQTVNHGDRRYHCRCGWVDTVPDVDAEDAPVVEGFNARTCVAQGEAYRAHLAEEIAGVVAGLCHDAWDEGVDAEQDWERDKRSLDYGAATEPPTNPYPARTTP